MARRDVFCQRLLVGVLATTVAILSGCGGSDRPRTIPITGRVTIDGQPPGEGGKLFFLPTEAAAGYNKRPASGSFGVDGSYRVMSWEPDDGLVPGHYAVSLMPGDPAKTKIAAKFQNNATSGLEVDVPVDQDTIEYNVEVRTK